MLWAVSSIAAPAALFAAWRVSERALRRGVVDEVYPWRCATSVQGIPWTMELTSYSPGSQVSTAAGHAAAAMLPPSSSRFEANDRAPRCCTAHHPRVGSASREDRSPSSRHTVPAIGLARLHLPSTTVKPTRTQRAWSDFVMEALQSAGDRTSH